MLSSAHWALASLLRRKPWHSRIAVSVSSLWNICMTCMSLLFHPVLLLPVGTTLTVAKYYSLNFLPDSVLLFGAHSKKKQGSLGAVQHHTFCSVRGITGCTRWTTPPNIFAERDRGKLWHWGCSTTWHRSEIAWWRKMLYKHR